MELDEHILDALARWSAARDAGQSLSAEELCADFPDLTAEVRKRIEALRAMDWLAEPLSSVPRPDPWRLGQPTPDAANEQTVAIAGDAGSAIPTAGPLSRFIGDYELLTEIARGGMGVVFKARQRKLNRIVALKMILAGQLATEEDVRRFQTEAEAAAQLEHPAIVPIYEVGEHNGLRYFSMGYVEGQSLAYRLAEGPLPPRTAAELLQTVAQAVQYAHSKGVIHRDLKPGNILLDPIGQPRITDFGLAKRSRGDSSLTGTGQVLGTPNYMPPEQAQGRADLTREPADIYALGAVLYTMLTGRPPFAADNPVDTLRLVLEREPVPPRQLNPTIPADLETICLKCLEKPIARRYASAQEVAQELAQFLGGLPISARPVSSLQRGWRWCQRNRAMAALSAAVLLGTLLGLAGLAGATLLYRGQRDLARTNELKATKTESRAVAAEQDALRRLWQARLGSAETQASSGQLGKRFQTLATLREALPLARREGLSDAELLRFRNAAIAALMQTDFEEVRSWPALPGGPALAESGFSFDSTLSRYAHSTVDGQVFVRESAGDRVVAQWSGLGSAPRVWLSADGKRLAIARASGVEGTSRMQVWELRDGAPPTAILPREEPCHGDLALSPEGSHLALFSPARELILLRLSSGQRTVCPAGQVTGNVEFSPTGDRVSALYRISDGRWRIEVRRVQDGTLYRQITLAYPLHHAWHPGGTQLVVDLYDRRTILVDIATPTSRAPPLRLNRSGSEGRSRFSPTGRYLLWTDGQSLLHVWDVAFGAEVSALPISGNLWFWASDERHLAVAEPGGRLWLLKFHPATTLRKIETKYRSWEHHVGSDVVVASPREALLAVDVRQVTGPYVQQGEIALIDPRQGRELIAISGTQSRPIAFRTDGSLLATGKPLLQLWPRGNDETSQMATFGPVAYREGRGTAHQLSADRAVKDVAIASHYEATVTPLAERRADEPPTTLSLDPSREPLLLEEIGGIHATALSPDGAWLATGDSEVTAQGRGLKVWNRQGQLHRELPAPPLERLGFSPDGRWLWGTGGGSVLYETHTWQPLDVPGATSFAFSEDGMLLAFGEQQGSLRIVEAGTRRELARLSLPQGGRLRPKCFYDQDTGLALYDESSRGLSCLDLRQLRWQLAELDLDWNGRPARPSALPPAQPLMLVGRGYAEFFAALGELDQLTPTRIDAARTALEKCVAAGPPQEPFVCEGAWRLAWLLLAMPTSDERLAQAEKVARQTVAVQPSHPEARQALALAKLRRGDAQAALDDAESLLQDARCESLLSDLIVALAASKLGDANRVQAARERAARRRIDWMVSEQRNNFLDWLAARLEEQLEGGVAAQTKLRRDTYPQLLAEQRDKARLQYVVGRDAAVYRLDAVAVSGLTRAIELGGAPADAHYFRAVCWERMGQLPNAEQDVERALQQRPGHPNALALRGRLAVRHSDWQLVANAWRAVLASGGRSPEMVFAVASLQAFGPPPLRDDSAALALAETIRKNEGGVVPREVEAQALACALRADWPAALQHLKTASEHPTGPSVWNLMLQAIVRHHLGDLASAQQMYDQAAARRMAIGALRPEDETAYEMARREAHRLLGK